MLIFGKKWRCVLLGAGLGTVVPVVAIAQNLPDTPACRSYRAYAATAGAPGTLGRLTELYNSCMRSAANRPEVQRHRCANGTYESFVGGVRRCVAR